MGKPLNYLTGWAKLIRTVGGRGSLWLRNREMWRGEKEREEEGRGWKERRGKGGEVKEKETLVRKLL